MRLLSPPQAATLRDWFRPDRPGPMIGLHVLNTGNGSWYVDRWPDPRAALVETGGNYAFAGAPAALRPDDLREQIVGFVDAAEPFAEIVRAAFPDVGVWDRVILTRPATSPSVPEPDAVVRRLEAADASHVLGLSPTLTWISKTWGGPAALAASGHAWGAFVDGRLVSVACSFFVGTDYEDIGVVTEPGYRRRGLSAACAGRLCEDIIGRRRRPCWTTATDHVASLGVARTLGFEVQRQDRLYVVGVSVPRYS